MTGYEGQTAPRLYFANQAFALDVAWRLVDLESSLAAFGFKRGCAIGS